MTTTSLTLQNPAGQDSDYLLEVLLEQSIDALCGGAAYAWATPRGIALLLGDDVFEDFLRTGDFQLIVGVDAITTPAALQKLAEAESRFPTLTVRAFMSADGEGLFHPKLAWFGRGEAGSLIVGSGNLTGGGLWGNREAFTLSQLDRATMADVQQQWVAWRTANATRLYPVSDSEVLERAKQNTGWTHGRRGPVATPPPSARHVPSVSTADDERTLLIAEIPASGNRWKQANFDKSNYEQFFGAKVGTQRHMLFQSLRGNGTLGEVESRPSVEVASHNWRFELDAASGLDYPESGRPIGVFLRLKPRTFVYLLSMPGDGYYDELAAHLAGSDVADDQIRRLREKVSDAEDLEDVRRLVAASQRAFCDDVPV